jgi:hypothetical protein
VDRAASRGGNRLPEGALKLYHPSLVTSPHISTENETSETLPRYRRG